MVPGVGGQMRKWTRTERARERERWDGETNVAQGCGGWRSPAGAASVIFLPSKRPYAGRYHAAISLGHRSANRSLGGPSKSNLVVVRARRASAIAAFLLAGNAWEPTVCIPACFLAY